MTTHQDSEWRPVLRRPSLRSCPFPIIPLSLSREEGMIHFFVGSHVEKPESGLFSDWIGNNTLYVNVTVDPELVISFAHVVLKIC